MSPLTPARACSAEMQTSPTVTGVTVSSSMCSHWSASAPPEPVVCERDRMADV
jgi:hypothetical protein